ncbi:MAG: hypothetical protein A2X04_15555 [Bacteroidetes bacterium GWF2_41_9]|nr:MAG: hypothetical protein A2X03_12945 [Bacteroidetes bacterium GWA2_40_15]OFX82848.1 MAG: hypothetical protein A2X06_03950 [Bacteroidetes bacterium GWC2_40_22]OFY61381.1 MAG: hypothetical protein A2X04_15555 [Bacteroidetes bacterium GWF2_41_9]HAM11167.1 hypothetical protein [Bacteroidales bacterium]HBH83553.1 hypothetical protein [Bacteroidales bacterium]
MKIKILTGAILLMISNFVSSQFVGDGASSPQSNKSTTAGKANFSIKFGAAMPLSLYGTTPNRSSIPQYSSGVMGAKTGFIVEAGMGLNLTNPDKMVGFYYFPILASYWKTSLDWSSIGGFFSNKEIYSKPVSIMDIAQRYGVFVNPIDNLSLAFYYRPGLIIPFKYEIAHESTSAGESFLFTGEMAIAESAPALMMSHTGGFSARYGIAAISMEYYTAKPTYDVTYKDIDTSPTMNVNVKSTGKIPVKLLVISLALNF